MNSDTVISYLPKLYDNVNDMTQLCEAEQTLFDHLYADVEILKGNQFVSTCDLQGIYQYEKIFGIVANPFTESLSFRRERILNRMSLDTPYTIQFLRDKLDKIVGVGKWAASVDFDTYTLSIECSELDQSWYQEISATVNKVKPANIVFINKPLLNSDLLISEECSYSTTEYNYRLGTTWVLGTAPFWSFDGKGIIKMATVPSIKPQLLQEVATFTATDIASVLLNDTVSITTFETKSATDGIITVEYLVAVGVVDNITNIKLRNTAGDILAESAVYMPVIDQVVMKHVITVKEG